MHFCSAVEPRRESELDIGFIGLLTISVHARILGAELVDPTTGHSVKQGVRTERPKRVKIASPNGIAGPEVGGTSVHGCNF